MEFTLISTRVTPDEEEFLGGIIYWVPVSPFLISISQYFLKKKMGGEDFLTKIRRTKKFFREKKAGEYFFLLKHLKIQD